MGAIDPELIARFSEGLDALWPVEEREGGLGLAVSGGPDSLAMLLLAASAISDTDLLAVASIDHGLRAEAPGEVALVEAICSELGVSFTPIKVSLGHGNVQARAREARYAALRKWAEGQGLGAVATAHHADDQAETLLMRLARGSGLPGLSGVRAWGDLPGSEIALVRPLLGFRKTELESVLSAVGITPARDPSNEDRAFDRVRVREHLARHPWLDAQALSQSAGHLGEAMRALEWYALLDWEEMVALEEEDAADGPVYRYYANVPRFIQIETLCRIVEALGGRVTRAEAGRAADRLWAGENASLGGVLATPEIEKITQFGTEMRVWRFRPEPPRSTH